MTPCVWLNCPGARPPAGLPPASPPTRPVPILSFSSARDRRWRTANAIANFVRCSRPLTYLAAAPAVKFATATSPTTRSQRLQFASMGPNCVSPARRRRRRKARAHAEKRSAECWRRPISLAFSFFPMASMSTAASSSPALSVPSANAVSVTGGLAGDGADFVETLVGCRLRAAQTYCRCGWLLRANDPHRPRQRRWLGRVRPAASHYPLSRQCAVRVRRRAGAATFMSAIWARRRRGVFRDPGCCSRFAFSIRSGRIMTSFGQFLRSIATRGP